MPRPDLHQDCLELLLSVYLKEFFLKSSFEIKQQTTNKSMQGLLGYLLITYANLMDPDQARQNVAPDLYPNRKPVLANCNITSL